MKTAKKLCLCGAAIFFGFTLFAQNNSTDLTPLAGIWENSNRIISVNEDNSLQFVLKTFYGFYYDKGEQTASQSVHRLIAEEETGLYDSEALCRLS